MKAPTRRLPRQVSSDTHYTKGLLHGRKWAIEDRITNADALDEAWHRGHTAGMYAAAEYIAKQVGITL